MCVNKGSGKIGNVGVVEDKVVSECVLVEVNDCVKDLEKNVDNF